MAAVALLVEFDAPEAASLFPQALSSNAKGRPAVTNQEVRVRDKKRKVFIVGLEGKGLSEVGFVEPVGQRAEIGGAGILNARRGGLMSASACRLKICHVVGPT